MQLQFDEICNFNCRDAAVNSIRFLSIGDHIIAASSDKAAHLFSCEKGKEIQIYDRGHTDVVTDVATSEHVPHMILTVGLDKRALLWNTETAQIIRQLPRTAKLYTCLLKGSGAYISQACVLGDERGCIRILDIRTRNSAFSYIQSIHDPRDSITSLLSTDDALIASSLDGCIYTYDIRKGLLNIDALGAPITNLSMSIDSTAILASCTDASIRLIDFETFECLYVFVGHSHTFASGLRLRSDLFTSDKHLKSINNNGSYIKLNELSGVQTPDISSSAMDDLLERKANDSSLMHPFVISGSEDNQVYIWDIEAIINNSEISMATLPVHHAQVLGVRTHEVSQRVCTAAADGCIKVWKHN